MYNTFLLLHQCVAFLFFCYIIIDRLYIRIFIKEENRKVFYANSKIPLLFISFLLFLSGIYLSFNVYITLIVIIKIASALFLISAFFYCPYFMKKNCNKIQRFLYRYLVVVLLIVTIGLGLYL